MVTTVDSNLQIIHIPDPRLRVRCKRVRKITRRVKALAGLMTVLMLQAEGVGLAANQVGDRIRLITVMKAEKEPIAYVNPEITRRYGQRVISEACLSIPGQYGNVARSERVDFRAELLDGEPVAFTTDGLMAQILEHEIDHLNGVLFTDRLVA